jgi:acyl-CoA synthetase (NDP forming)
VAGFRTPESCADAVNTYLNWRPPLPPDSAAVDEIAAADALLSATTERSLNEQQSLTLFTALGIEGAKSMVVQTRAYLSTSSVRPP